DGENWTRQSMTPASSGIGGAVMDAGTGADGRYTFTIGPLAKDCRYQVSGGDARSGIYIAHVLSRPVVLRYHVALAYPPYLLRDVRGATGELTLRAIPDRPPQVRLVLPPARRELLASPWDVIELPFRATDDHGVASATAGITTSSALRYQQPVDAARLTPPAR